LIEVKKRRRKISATINDKKSATLQIQINSTPNSTPLNIIHRPNCPLYQKTGSLSVPTHISTPSSINPYSIDAPAASPELSDVMDSVHTPSLIVEPPINPHSPVVNLSTTPILSPIIVKTRRIKSTNVAGILCPDVNTTPSAHNIVENLLVKTMDRKTSIQFCECHRDDDISEGGGGEEEEDEDDNDNNHEAKKKKKKSKIGLLCDRYFLSYFTKCRQLISKFVGSKHFRRVVLSAIVINTLSMGIEYHGQPQSLTNALEYSNLVFTSLFAIEMILKIIAEGCLKYIRNAYNLFDGAIVIMSVVELQGNKNSGLSVLRTFRLLRVLKLVRFMPTLRRQLVRTFSH
jgi:hypothetical protein